MSNCCSPKDSGKQDNQTAKNTRLSCPENDQECIEVPFNTVLHHVLYPWRLKLEKQRYYFCTDPGCDVVYFSENGDVLEKESIRTKVGIKETDPNALICYCYGISKHDIAMDCHIKKFVIEQTKNKSCACESFNPSGRCCLKDFPK